MRALGFPVKKTELVKLVHEVDPQNEGAVSLANFLEIMTDKYAALDPEEEMLKAFHLFDDDGTGKINIKVEQLRMSLRPDARRVP